MGSIFPIAHGCEQPTISACGQIRQRGLGVESADEYGRRTALRAGRGQAAGPVQLRLLSRNGRRQLVQKQFSGIIIGKEKAALSSTFF
jgi:hypothetical protein